MNSKFCTVCETGNMSVIQHSLMQLSACQREQITLFPKAQKSDSLALCEPEGDLYQGTENTQNKPWEGVPTFEVRIC